jgi:predicted transcriptional regulator
MTLADWMRRESKTREEVADCLRVSEASVCRYLTGARMPRSSVMLRIKSMTRNEVTADDFLAPPIEAAA